MIGPSHAYMPAGTMRSSVGFGSLSGEAILCIVYYERHNGTSPLQIERGCKKTESPPTPSQNSQPTFMFASRNSRSGVGTQMAPVLMSPTCYVCPGYSDTFLVQCRPKYVLALKLVEELLATNREVEKAPHIPDSPPLPPGIVLPAVVDGCL